MNQHPNGRFYCAPCYREFGTRGTTRVGRPKTQVEVSCVVCGKTIKRYPWIVAKNKTGEFWCEGECAAKGRSQGLKARHRLKARELDRIHNGLPARIDFAGYVLIYEPGARWAKGKPTGWAWEHRYVVEQRIGRRLTSAEQVHHVNGIKTDNSSENLVVLSRREHRQLHNDEIAEKLRKLEEYERRFGPLKES